MMTKNKSKTRTFLKQLAVIPLFICFMLLFSAKTIAQNKGASKALIEEYESKLQKSNGSVIVKGEDVKRLYHIYSLMSEEQKAKATKIPPPPPPLPAPTTPKMEKDHDITLPPVPEPMNVNEIAPPPPLPKDATYFINGKKVSLKQVKELDSDDILKINVVKKEGSKKGEVYITTK